MDRLRGANLTVNNSKSEHAKISIEITKKI